MSYRWICLFVCVLISATFSLGIVTAQKLNPAALQQKADKLYLAKKWADAAKAYEKIVKLSPGNGTAWFRLGLSWHAAGDYAKAVKAHTKAATFPKAKSVALYNLACAQALLGNKDDAFAALQQAVDAGFVNQQQIAKDNDLRSLRGDPRLQKVLAHIEALGKVYRQFDFWIGDWDVVNKQGKKIGRNLVQKLEGGHILLENWDNLNGGSGKSLNFVDPADKKWKQIWIDNSGGVTRYEGEFTGGAMRFMGESMSKTGLRRHARMVFTPMPDGRVHQLIQQSTDEGKTWNPYFDGYYVRKKSAPN